jgi:hypothetical protein
MSEKQQLRIENTELKVKLRILKRIIKDVATRMECHCGDMDYDCMPCDRCILEKSGDNNE